MPPKPSRQNASQGQISGKKAAAPPGITPTLLLDQVRNTAPWALSQEPRLPAAEILLRAPETEQRWRQGEAREDYLACLLAAHFTTVATFVPTDVDRRIRQHAWATLEGKWLASAVALVETVTSWDVRPVSARHVVVGDEVLGGHQGEWFSVMAGALGRALALSDTAIVERTSAWIEGELAREARIIEQSRQHGDDQQLLSVVTTVAHNLGDLSRVVETWPANLAASPTALRYLRLGHEDASRFGGAFVFAGELNKQLMAKENHRFLPLRTPRALRRERAFLLPFGPYFYEWGRTIGGTPLLEDQERAEILLALLKVHERGPEEAGCLRAIAGIQSVSRGTLDRIVRLLSPEARALMLQPGVRQALRVPEPEFLRTFHATVAR
jgi:hypothetical protein